MYTFSFSNRVPTYCAKRYFKQQGYVVNKAVEISLMKLTLGGKMSK